ncbi:MAG: hypothetical protein ABW252_11105 [Polyangiales bacterium]
MSDKKTPDGDERLRELIATYLDCAKNPEVPRQRAEENELFSRIREIALPVYRQIMHSEADAQDGVQKLVISMSVSLLRQQPARPAGYFRGAAYKRASTAYKQRKKYRERFGCDPDIEKRPAGAKSQLDVLIGSEARAKGSQEAQKVLQQDDLQTFLRDIGMHRILERSNTWQHDEEDAPHTKQARTLPQLASVFAKLRPYKQMAFLLAARMRDPDAVVIHGVLFPNETDRPNGGILTDEQKLRRRGSFEKWRSRVRQEAKKQPILEEGKSTASSTAKSLTKGHYAGLTLVQALVVRGHEVGLSDVLIGLIFSLDAHVVSSIITRFNETKGKQS